MQDSLHASCLGKDRMENDGILAIKPILGWWFPGMLSWNMMEHDKKTQKNNVKTTSQTSLFRCHCPWLTKISTQPTIHASRFFETCPNGALKVPLLFTSKSLGVMNVHPPKNGIVRY
jgi:hypothetical protein